MTRIAPAPSIRFWAKVDRSGGRDACWPWQGCLSTDGYGRFTLRRGKLVQAHRFAYEDLARPIPDGLTIDHLCFVPACVNPDHMEPVTMRQNILRGNNLAARNARKTHCKRGHPFDAVNTARPKAGGRKCRRCNADWQLAYLRRVAA